jgi:RNA polymerase sigma-70 factor (ECF subfamily)
MQTQAAGSFATNRYQIGCYVSWGTSGPNFPWGHNKSRTWRIVLGEPPIADAGRSATLAAADEGKLDPSIVAALYVQHGEELRRFLLGLLRDPALASDVLQVTFARLVERGHETREGTRKAWLFRVAYHEAMAQRRRQAVGEKVTRRFAWHTNGEAICDEDFLVRYESVESVRTALAELRPEERQVVRMRIYEDKTFAQIAKELGIPLGTALGRMRTALQKLRRKLPHPEANEDEATDGK